MQPISNLIQKDGQAVPMSIDDFVRSDAEPVLIPQVVVSSNTQLKQKITCTIDATPVTDRFVLTQYIEIATDIMQRLGQCVLIAVAPFLFKEDSSVQVLFREAPPARPIVLSGKEVPSMSINRDVPSPKWGTQPRFSDYVLTSVVDTQEGLGLGVKQGSNPFSDPKMYARTPNAVSVSEELDVTRLVAISKTGFLRWLFEQDETDDAASSGVCFIAHFSKIRRLETPLIDLHQVYSVDGGLKLNVVRNAVMRTIDKVTLSDGTTWPVNDFLRIVGHNRARPVLFINAPLDSVVVSHSPGSLVIYNDEDKPVVSNDEFLYDIVEARFYMGLTQFTALCDATDIVYSRLPTHTLKTTLGEVFTAIAGGSVPEISDVLATGPHFKYATQEQTTHDWILTAPFAQPSTVAFIV